MIMKQNRKGLIVLIISLLVLSLLNFSSITAPFFGPYDVNPDYYTTNVDSGDSRTYIFDRIRFQDHMSEFEEREMMVMIPFEGEDIDISVSEGSKVTIAVINVNDTHIESQWVWSLINGSVFNCDPIYFDKSSLLIDDHQGYGPRMVFTTNVSLIEEVYSSTSWNYEINMDRVRIFNESWEDPYSSREEYEYDLSTGFLTNLRISFEGPDSRMEIEIRETETWNPDWFELGVNVGDTNTYVLSKMTWYDGYDGTYHHDTYFLVVVDGNPIFLLLHQGDEIVAEVINTAGDFVELQLTFKQLKEDKVTIDENPYRIDKSTFYAPRDLGAPLLMTTNRTTWEYAAPGDVVLGEDVVKFHNENTSSDGQWFDMMEGAWNLTTGWLQRFYTVKIEDPEGDKIIQHEMEILDVDLIKPEGPAEFISVSTGDSITYEFKEIQTADNDKINMTFPDQQIWIQAGDTMTVKIKGVQGSFVTVELTIDSAIDGEVVVDPITFDITKFDEGPQFLLPTEKQMIEDFFKDTPDVELIFDDTKSATITTKFTNGDREYHQKRVFDLETGWLIEYNQTVFEKGDLVEKVYAISTDISIDTSEPEATGTGPEDIVELTPIPLFPVILSLIIVVGLLRKKNG